MAFSSGPLLLPSSLSVTSLTVSILILPDLCWSHPGSFVHCLGPKQNEIWILTQNNLRSSFQCRKSQLFCSLCAANWLNRLFRSALSLSASLAYRTVGSQTARWECLSNEGRGDRGEWASITSPVFTCVHVCMHEHMAHTHTQTIHTATQTRPCSNSSTLSTRGLCVLGWEMPCQRIPHGSLEGREKLNSIKKECVMKNAWKGEGDSGCVQSYPLGSSCISCIPSFLSSCLYYRKPLNRHIQIWNVTHMVLWYLNSAPMKLQLSLLFYI